MVVSQQIVVKRNAIGMTAKNGPHAMRRGLGGAFVDMNTLIEALADNRPLHSDVANTIRPGRQGFINPPAQRAMIDDHIVNITPRTGRTQPNGIALGRRRATRILVTWAHPQSTHNHIVSADAQRTPF